MSQEELIKLLKDKHGVIHTLKSAYPDQNKQIQQQQNYLKVTNYEEIQLLEAYRRSKYQRNDSGPPPMNFAPPQSVYLNVCVKKTIYISD
ncbi:hypothetical protein DFA_11567 [Cavenderia fasciculata]|uniref:Uncharacterized protein n=1 Tax=Cavenderia fasciculata TaxID=261658 RepID=F4QDK9_CACFS|nr:uncharacterized protein DFA_11567 [Cavenderia fasciculata]EGG13806.1 hypothetical protein DFA_11567 [Cavenderia fasciculata]|eukprot:XP_004350514.1 hypothetical protein DFA_11567 [Cavenderia fasciculata]